MLIHWIVINASPKPLEPLQPSLSATTVATRAPSVQAFCNTMELFCGFFSYCRQLTIQHPHVSTEGRWTFGETFADNGRCIYCQKQVGKVIKPQGHHGWGAKASRRDMTAVIIPFTGTPNTSEFAVHGLSELLQNTLLFHISGVYARLQVVLSHKHTTEIGGSRFGPFSCFSAHVGFFAPRSHE